VPAGVRPAGILATDDGVYVSNFTSDTLTRYTADAGGALTRVTPDVAAPHSPFGLALSPDGRSLYVAGFGSGTIGQYDVGADGALTAKSPAAVAADVRPVAVATVRGPDVQAPAFEGFVGPVQDGSVVKAGSVVPIAFSLGGFHGLDVLGDGSPSSVRVACDDPGEAVGGDAAESADGLRFDEASGTYTFAWQTHRAWARTCRAFVVTLRDGSSARIVVRFRSPHWHRWHRRW
jgi:hypothetical protein